MTRLLHVISSPRGADSTSRQLATNFIEAYRATHPDAEIDELDLWNEPVPTFDGDHVAAKMRVIGGGSPTGAETTAWNSIAATFARFDAADHYLFGVPMWNSGVPWILKHYIDTITQPGLLFSFDPVHGYTGLLRGKRAAVIYTSSVYEDGRPAPFGIDHQTTFFNDWLRFAGIEDVAEIRSHRTSPFTPDIETRQAVATAQAAEVAASF